MLRIITQWAEAQSELERIANRTHDETATYKEATVQEILRAVKSQGDEALLRYTAEFDHVDLTAEELKVSGSELDAAYQQVNKELLDAIRLACTKIERFHRQRMPKSWVEFCEDQVVLGKRYTPVDRAGLYVPGG
ncbi:MAG: histidinol dehydrogenase, partial [Microcoleaceae cyanobacterium]